MPEVGLVRAGGAVVRCLVTGCTLRAALVALEA